MAHKSIVTALTAQNATETTPTLIATQLVPKGVTKLVGVSTQGQSAGYTTLEDYGHIIELKSDDDAGFMGGTQAFVNCGAMTGIAGDFVMAPYVHPCNIPVSPGTHIQIWITYNMALTINPSTRAMLQFE